MKVESRIFEIVAVFFLITAVVYGVLSRESAGTAVLFLTGGLSVIIGTYFRFVSRRIRQRPEDNPEGEIADGAGEVGFFPPGSYWPFALALAAAFVSVALAFWYIWLLVIAMIVLFICIGGLVFEYYLRPSGH